MIKKINGKRKSTSGVCVQKLLKVAKSSREYKLITRTISTCPLCLFPKWRDLSVEQMNQYASPINPAVLPHLTVVLLSIGIFFMAWFFVNEVISIKYSRNIYIDLLVSLVASLFMGFGVLFLLLWVGIYV